MTGHDVGGITSALARTDLMTTATTTTAAGAAKGEGRQREKEAPSMVASASQSSNGDQGAKTGSAYSLNASESGGSAGNGDALLSTSSSSIQIQRPPYLRQSFSDGSSYVAPTSSSTADGLQGGGGGVEVSFGAASLPNNEVPVSMALSGPLSASDPRTQLYVSNLPYRVRWQDLKDLFRRAGTVLRADVSLTPENRSRGFGTVLLATEDDARRACEMFRGFNWQGRTLDVKIDRSGTLLGVGVGQLGPSAALMATANAMASVTPHTSTPLSPSTAMLGGASPSLSTLSSHSFAAPSSAGTSHLNVGNDTLSPTPSIGSPAIQPQSSNAYTHAHKLLHNNISPALSNAAPSTNGVSPALLPFLNSSTRASLTAGTSSPLSNSTSPSIQQQQQASYNLLQQRSASLGGVGVVAPGQAGSPSPFAVGRQSPAHANFQASPSPFYGATNVPSLAHLGQQAMRQSLVGSVLHPPTSTYGHAGQQINSIGGVVLPQMQANPSAAAAMTQSHAYYGRVLFVGNLPFHCQWQDLKDLFRAAGNIQRADVALTGEGKSRGFGTVLFATPEDAQNAVRIYHGYEYSGRTLKVHFDRFAQMTVPPAGSLPASPSQYTSAFAAANTPTPASNQSANSNVYGVPGQQTYQQQQSFGHAFAAPMQQQQQHQQQHQHQQQQAAYAYGQATGYVPYQQPGFSVPGRQQAFYNNNNGNGVKQGDSQPTFSAPFGQQRQHGSFSYGPPYGQTASPFASALGYSGLQPDVQQARRTSDAGSQAGASNQGERAADMAKKDADSAAANEQSGGAAKKSDARSEAEKGETTASSSKHPGRIELPPQNFAPPTANSFSPMHPRMSVPMTPGMPGFTFHAIPDTPPVMPHHFLSPGLGGPFSPPLASPTFNGPATPGAPYVGFGRTAFNPAINAAPGAPIHVNNGAITPLAGGMVPPDAANFNPMFPPIGAPYQQWPVQEERMAYGQRQEEQDSQQPLPTGSAQQQQQSQQQQQTRLPQTPHWSQPRQSQKPRGANAEPLAESDGTAAGEEKAAQDAAALLEIQQSTGATSTEDLARKIAQMSAQKALLQQQQRVRVGSVPSIVSAAEEEVKGQLKAGGVEMRSQSSSTGGSMLDAPLELRIGRRSSQLRLSSSALSGSALDDERAAEKDDDEDQSK